MASKHGVVGLTKVVALEAAGTGVTANTICPGWVMTPLVRAQIEARAKANHTSFDVEKVALVSEKHPSQGFVRPSDIGKMAVFLCTEAGDQITGAQHSMDGACLQCGMRYALCDV